MLTGMAKYTMEEGTITRIPARALDTTQLHHLTEEEKPSNARMLTNNTYIFYDKMMHEWLSIFIQLQLADDRCTPWT